jgi:hypothetical protein
LLPSFFTLFQRLAFNSYKLLMFARWLLHLQTSHNIPGRKNRIGQRGKLVASVCIPLSS